jgi:hypothetical protein
MVTLFATAADIKRVADMAHAAGFNTLIIQLREGARPDSAPWTPQNDAIDREGLRDVIAHARALGLKVIPEIKLLTHQEKFFQDNYPDLMFNKVTYDPRNPRTYEVVHRLLNEVIDLFEPPAIHIGHDEVVGWNERHAEIVLAEGDRSLPAELFLQDVLALHVFLKNRGIETWIWGDALVAPSEFPGMLQRHLHGGLPGYGKALRDKLPRDIVICDWHYFDRQREFPTIATLRTEGFRVLGSTFHQSSTIENFSRSASRNGAIGMIATTWYFMPQNKWRDVAKIIEESGAAFRRDFPDDAR